MKNVDFIFVENAGNGGKYDSVIVAEINACNLNIDMVWSIPLLIFKYELES
jgi:hypothetical protein